MAAKVPRLLIEQERKHHARATGGESTHARVANLKKTKVTSRRAAAFSMNEKGWAGQIENIKRFIDRSDGN